MTATNRRKLNALLTQLPAGAPLTTGALRTLGISADLAVHYVRSGWLTRLARGVYCRKDDTLLQNLSLLLLERQIAGLHVGGKSALTWYGITHYVSQHRALHLYGWAAARLPGWFVERFPAEYHRKRLFNERPSNMVNVNQFEKRVDAPLVSAPERAFLELLSEVGVRQPLQEAQELAESMHTLRADVLEKLLLACSSVKTVRLCLKLGRELSLPWASKLTPTRLPTGSNRSWVSRSKDGLLVLKP